MGYKLRNDKLRNQWQPTLKRQLPVFSKYSNTTMCVRKGGQGRPKIVCFWTFLRKIVGSIMLIYGQKVGSCPLWKIFALFLVNGGKNILFAVKTTRNILFFSKKSLKNYFCHLWSARGRLRATPSDAHAT